MSDVAIIQSITFLTVIAGFTFQAYREARQRKWDVEDRAQLAAKVVSEATSVAKTVLAQADQLKIAIQENTDISTKAFHEANGTNLKLAALGLEHNQLQAERQAFEKRTEDDSA